MLLEGTRGAGKQPGEFRLSQNWVGPAGATLEQASFVPPPPRELTRVLSEFELYLHAEEPYPILVHTGLMHAQFKTIHPFLDGNGRVGRLLIAFLLCHHGVLSRPLLYLSSYPKLHRSEYYDRLTSIRTRGDWEGWLRYYLLGVAVTAEEATRTARAINDMRDLHRGALGEHRMRSNAYLLLDHLFSTPVMNARRAEQLLEVSYPTANRLLGQITELGILQEITGRDRDRLYRYDQYLDLFRKSTPDADIEYDLTATTDSDVPR
ncbi:MAG: Fic family protein [Thermomicrobiales bacterium]